MLIKPFNDVSEHDIVNLFAVSGVSSLPLGTLVTVVGSGFVNGASHGIAFNINPTTNNGNVYTPRWEVKAKVAVCDSGNASGVPLGFTLYQVQEYNFQGVSFLYDPVRKVEAQAVVSGEAVPVARKGLFLVGGFPSGTSAPVPGSLATMGATGSWNVVPQGTTGLHAFGVFLGAPDADGYSLVAVDFNRALF